MEFLGKESKELFRELVDDTYPSITMAGVEYKRGTILLNMHPEGFNELYDDFVERCKTKGAIEEARDGLLSKKLVWATAKGELTTLKLAIDVVKEMEI